jgi:hypothetical protein
VPLGSWRFVVQAEPLGLSRHSCGRPILELRLPDNVDAKFGVARLPQTDGTAAHLGGASFFGARCRRLLQDAERRRSAVWLRSR